MHCGIRDGIGNVVPASWPIVGDAWDLELDQSCQRNQKNICQRVCLSICPCEVVSVVTFCSVVCVCVSTPVSKNFDHTQEDNFNSSFTVQGGSESLTIHCPTRTVA